MSNSILLWLGAYALHSTLFLGAAWAFERIFPKATPQLISSFWRIALIAGAFTATLQASGLVQPIAGLFTVPAEPATIIQTETVYAQPAAAIATTQATASPAQSVAAEPVATDTTVVSDRSLLDLPQLPAINWQDALLAIWGAIALILALRAAFMWWAADRELSDRKPVVRGPLFERIQAIAARVGLRRLPQVSFSERIAGPFTLPNGEICIPVWARERLPQDQLDAMLAHEMAHVLHKDSLWLAIGMGVSTVFHFQPLNLLARKRLAHLAELSADDWAATQAGGGRALAECISSFVGFAHANAKARVAPEYAAAMAKPNSPLVQRVERLISGRYTNGVLPMKSKLLVAACAIALAALMPGLVARAQMPPPIAPAAPVAPAPPALLAHIPAPVAPPSPPAPVSPVAPAAPLASELYDLPAPQAPEIPEAPEVPQAPDAPDQQVPSVPPVSPVPSIPSVPAVPPGPFSNDDDNHISIHSGNGLFGGPKRMEISSTSQGSKLEIKSRGDFHLQPDGSGFASLDSGATFDITLDKNFQKRRVLFTGQNGSIKREFWVGGQSRAWGPEADQLVAEIMPRLFRDVGLDTEQRVAWLKRRGDNAVLDEMNQITSDFVMGKYTAAYTETTKLNDAAYGRLLGVLKAKLNSDFTMTNAITGIYKTQQPTGRNLVELVNVAKTIDSDFQSGQVLAIIGPSALTTAEGVDAYLEIASSINSDFEMANALKRFVKSKSVSEGQLVRALDFASKQINSDFELGNVLMTAAPRIGPSDVLAKAYLDASRSVNSDFTSGQVLQALADDAQLTPSGWRQLLDTSAHINSDFTKASVLVSVADRLPRQGDVSAAYDAAVKSINSDFDRNRATKARRT